VRSQAHSSGLSSSGYPLKGYPLRDFTLEHAAVMLVRAMIGMAQTERLNRQGDGALHPPVVTGSSVSSTPAIAGQVIGSGRVFFLFSARPILLWGQADSGVVLAREG
jgi:hypothetical protein